MSTSAHSYSCGPTRRCGSTGVRYWSPLAAPAPTRFAFNNALDADLFDPDDRRRRTGGTGWTVSQSGNVITMRGAWLPTARTRVTIPAGLTDVHGQTWARTTPAR